MPEPNGQFLALVLLPLASPGLVVVVFAETVVSGYRRIQSDRSLREYRSTAELFVY